MEREAVLVGIDVGTSKVCALIGEISRDGRLTIMGHGTVPASGLKMGVVINIDQTVRSIADAVERAERLSGWKIDRAFVGVGGQHVESLNSPGQVAVTGHQREVTREDVNRAIEVARAVSIPSNREVLHVERRGFTVDGQEGVKDPLGMSALRLEVETHIITASATAVQNLSKCVAAAGVKIDELEDLAHPRLGDLADLEPVHGAAGLLAQDGDADRLVRIDAPEIAGPVLDLQLLGDRQAGLEPDGDVVCDVVAPHRDHAGVEGCTLVEHREVDGARADVGHRDPEVLLGVVEHGLRGRE